MIKESVSNEDEVYMRSALALGTCAELAGEVPVGAVIVCDGRVVGRGWNKAWLTGASVGSE